jgi:hypothetical protein
MKKNMTNNYLLFMYVYTINGKIFMQKVQQGVQKEITSSISYE